MYKIDFSIMVENISNQIKSLEIEHKKVKYKPKCRICKEHCIARNNICPNDCNYNNNGYCSKYNIELKLFEDNIYFRSEDCFDNHINEYLKDKIK